jgi:hypothetical protein
MDKKVPRKGRRMKQNNGYKYDLQFKVIEDAVEKRKVKESDVFDKPKKNYKKSRPVKERISKKNQ